MLAQFAPHHRHYCTSYCYTTLDFFKGRNQFPRALPMQNNRAKTLQKRRSATSSTSTTTSSASSSSTTPGTPLPSPPLSSEQY
jgi:hypothetical protein